MSYRGKAGRGERIRTSDILLPKQALYQAELRPERQRIVAHLEASQPGVDAIVSRCTFYLVGCTPAASLHQPEFPGLNLQRKIF